MAPSLALLQRIQQRTYRRARILALCGVAALSGACGGGGGGTDITPPPPVVASVSVTLASSAIVAGQSTQATAAPRTSTGTAITGRSVNWSSSATNVATISSNGAITALTAGTTTITATVDGIAGNAQLTVTAAPIVVATVTVTLSNSAIFIGQATQATAAPRTSTGTDITGRAVTWSSSASNVATVSTTGAVTAVAAGTTNITATVDGVVGSAPLTVTPVPVASITLASDSIDLPLRSSLQLTATARDAAGTTLTGRTITWQVSPTTASISPAGIVRALFPGTVTVTATSEGKSATMRVRATVANLATLVDSIRTAHGLPGMGGAIVARDGLIGLGVAGFRRITGGQPVTVNDKWHLGSNTKALTGVLAGMAVQAGTVAWNRTLSQSFPDLAGVMRAEYRDVTLLELLNHTSGIVNVTSGMGSPADLPASRLSWASYSVQQPPVNARGTYFYSNNAFGMAGSVIERAWGSTYEQLMASRLFTPLALVNVGWGPTTVAGGTDQPVGHRRQNNAWVVCEACDNHAGLSAAGTVHMPLQSWARIIQELLLADQGRSTLLTQATARFLTTNHVPSGGGNSYGVGWLVSGGASNRSVGHDGSNTTNHSRAMLYLDAGVAFLITINAAELGVDGITTNAIDALQTRLDFYWQNGR